VLEIVERLCSHIAIIHHGELVAQGAIDQLRSGVAARSDGQKVGLEHIFLQIVGEERAAVPELSWLQ
jgi:ABC-2 type transport system ATP-binding protein